MDIPDSFAKGMTASVDRANELAIKQRAAELRAASIAAENAGSVIVERIVDRIKEFERSLGENEELVLRPGFFDGKIGLRLENVAADGESMLVFSGTDANTGERTTLIHHVQQLNFLLVASPREQGNERRPIGFSAVAAPD